MNGRIVFAVAAFSLVATTSQADAGCRYTPIVTSWYQNYLCRRPCPSEVRVWVCNLRGGMPMLRTKAHFLGCDEYWHRNGCNNRGFICGLYRDVLGRTPCEREICYWERQLCRCRDRAHFLECSWFPAAANELATPAFAPVAPPQYQPVPVAPAPQFVPQVRYEPAPIYVAQPIVPVRPVYRGHDHGHRRGPKSGVTISFTLRR